MLFPAESPIPARVIAPVPSLALISIAPNALLAPISPPTPIAPAFVSKVRLNGPLPEVSLLIVELKSIDPLLAFVVIVVLAVNIAGPLMSTLLLAPSVVVILPPRLTAPPPVKETDLTPDIVPPIVIVPVAFPPPSVIVTVSVAAPPAKFPVIVTLLPPELIVDAPLVVKFPEI